MYEGAFAVVTTVSNALFVALFVRYYLKTVWVFALTCGAINGIIMFLLLIAVKAGALPIMLAMVVSAVSPRPVLWLAHQVLRGRVD